MELLSALHVEQKYSIRKNQAQQASPGIDTVRKTVLSQRELLENCPLFVIHTLQHLLFLFNDEHSPFPNEDNPPLDGVLDESLSRLGVLDRFSIFIVGEIQETRT